MTLSILHFGGRATYAAAFCLAILTASAQQQPVPPPTTPGQPPGKSNLTHPDSVPKANAGADDSELSRYQSVRTISKAPTVSDYAHRALRILRFERGKTRDTQKGFAC